MTTILNHMQMCLVQTSMANWYNMGGYCDTYNENQAFEGACSYDFEWNLKADGLKHKYKT